MLRYLKNKDVSIISFLHNYVDVQSQTDNTLIFFIHFSLFWILILHLMLSLSLLLAEYPGLLCTGHGSHQRSTFRGYIRLFVLLVRKVPLRLPSLCNGCTVHS